jgi:tetrahydromethanopterin S-methyltransferase subunit G
VVSSEAEKIKKRFEEFEESVKKHTAEARQADKKRLEDTITLSSATNIARV